MHDTMQTAAGGGHTIPPAAPDCDPVNRPSHYIGADGLQAIDVVEDWGLGAHLAAAFTYLIRAPKKGNMIQDCQKAIWYLERAQSRNVIATLSIDNAPCTIGCLQVMVAFALPQGGLINAIDDIFIVSVTRNLDNRRHVLEMAADQVRSWIRVQRAADVAL